MIDRILSSLSPSSGEPASVAVEAGNHSPTFEDHQQALLSLYRSKDADIARLREFMTTLFVNAKKKPDDMTADLVAFMCDAALKNCTVTLAADKWQAEPAPLSKPTPVEAGMREDHRTMRATLEFIRDASADVSAAYLSEAAATTLAALSKTQPPRETSTHTGETGE